VKRKGEPEKRAFIGGFDHAWEGIVRAVRTQRNMRFHALAAVAVVVAGALLRVGFAEFSILFLSVAFVMAMELVNTAVEAVVDLVSPEFHPLAKIAKDAAAGAVLVASVGAAIIGAMIFIPRALELATSLLGAS
jgi:diacylglycerol kinase